MNLENIKKIVNSGFPNWETLLLIELATDSNALPYMMQLLANERQERHKLITDLNFQLSRAHLVLKHPETKKGEFVQKEIGEFYKSGRINHCFANMDK